MNRVPSRDGASLAADRVFRASAGFTLIEVLVVVSIIALLIAILLPSLSLARENTRAVVCMSNLKQVANANSMYVQCNSGFLPGPAHMLFYRDAYKKWVLPSSDPQRLAWYKKNLSFLLSKYMGDTGKNAAMMDKVTDCPTYSRLITAPPATTNWSYSATATYVINSHAGEQASQNIAPYWGTKIPYYFGYLNYGEELSDFSGDEAYRRASKKLDRIRNSSREWAMADLWYGAEKRGRSGTFMVGTWPNAYVAGTETSVFDANGTPKCPTWAYHYTSTTFDQTAGRDGEAFTSPRFKAGKFNVMYLDTHVAPVGRAQWRGTVNPNLKP